MSNTEEVGQDLEEEEQKDGGHNEGLDEQTVNYFKRLKDFLRDEEVDDESRKLFIGNVFVEMVGKEILLSQDQGLSRVMEDLLKHLSVTQLCTVLENIAKKDGFHIMCTDKFASHVMQTMVDLILVHISDKTGKSHAKLEQLFLDFCAELLSSLSEFITHTYASHVLRSVLQTLSGCKVLDSVIRSRASRYSRKKGSDKDKVKKVGGINQWEPFVKESSFSTQTSVPQTFCAVLQQITTGILNMKQFDSLAYHPLGNPVLQTLLLVLSVSDSHLCKKVCKAIMKQTGMFDVEAMSGDENPPQEVPQVEKRIPKLFGHDIGSHLVEKVLQVAKPKLQRKIFTDCFQGRLVALSSHNIANYIVQHLLASLTEEDQAETVIQELDDYVEDILARCHMGVVVRMAELCARMKVKQKMFIGSLLRVFHCQTPEERHPSLVRLLLSLTTYDIFFESTKESTEEEVKKDAQLKEINYHGAMILKALVLFEKNKLILKGFACLSAEELITMACDQHGSFVMETFFKSEMISQEKKAKIVKALLGHFHKLACSRYGSHVIDTCWSNVDIAVKDQIVSDLCDHHAELSRDFYGKFVLRNCGVEHYKVKKESWKEKEEQIVKKKQLFADILGEDVVQDIKPKKAKKPVSKEESSGKAQSKNLLNNNLGYSKELAALGFGTVDCDDDTERNLQGDSIALTKESDEIDILFNTSLHKKRKMAKSEGNSQDKELKRKKKHKQ